jgi:tRNA pseudouridine65 synthase
VLYRDDALVAVTKPAKLAVHRGWAVADHYALDLVRDLVGAKVYPVHRLDQPTSGVLVMALDSASAGALGRAFMEGRVEKRYLALTRGLPPEFLRLDHPVKDDDGVRRDAVTTFRRLWVFQRRYALVECRPETGRTHQIRKHLKHLSCPIIGDSRYGKGEHNRLFATEYGLLRLALHALELTVPHPTTGVPLTLTSPLPDDLAAPLSRIGCPLELLQRPHSPPVNLTPA